MAKAQLFELLNELRLPGMKNEVEHQLENPQYDTMPFTDRVTRIAQAEVERRYRNKIERLMKNAQFKVAAESEAISFKGERNLDKAEILDLLKCDWIKRKRNILITGASGTGKTWLACALGVSAVRHEMSVRYARANRIVEEFGYSRLDGSIPKLRKKIANLDLLILDDFALSPLKKQELTDLFEIIEDRSTMSSVIMISQRPAIDWYDYIGDPLIADAFMDRVRSKAYILELEGMSMRS